MSAAPKKNVVAIVKYTEPFESVKNLVALCNGLDDLPSKARVFIKPNIVFWTEATNFPKWGVITTSRVVEDMVAVLKDHGINDITIGEGTVVADPKDKVTQYRAFEGLGYNVLKKRYGIKYVNLFERPFEKIDLGDGIKLSFSTEILGSDFVVNLPVLKTHAQTVVSLGIKNIKGTIDIPSRKRCHNSVPGRDLNFMISRLADKMPPMFTLLDGIFSNERGPNIDGLARRSDVLVGSRDVFSADIVGSKMLGYAASDVPHLVYAAQNRGRSLDFAEIETVGEAIESVSSYHEYDFPYNDQETLPLLMEKMGIKGLSYRKYDLTMCTYCSSINTLLFQAIIGAWKKKPWDDVEILTGKSMKPTPGKKKTILVGKCIYQANKDNPDIQEMIAVKGCPPQPASLFKALQKAGIDADPEVFKNADKIPGSHMKKYKGKKGFDEQFFKTV